MVTPPGYEDQLIEAAISMGCDVDMDADDGLGVISFGDAYVNVSELREVMMTEGYDVAVCTLDRLRTVGTVPSA